MVVTCLGLDIVFADHIGDVRADFVLEVRDVKEAGLFEPDIDEGSLHPRQHSRDPSFVDVARETTPPISFEVKLGQAAVFEQCDPHLKCGSVDDNLSFHPSAVSSRRGGADQPCAIAHGSTCDPRVCDGRAAAM
jgi:hypothetical protein